jgi:hypothetical protein
LKALFLLIVTVAPAVRLAQRRGCLLDQLRMLFLVGSPC